MYGDGVREPIASENENVREKKPTGVDVRASGPGEAAVRSTRRYRDRASRGAPITGCEAGRDRYGDILPLTK